MENENAEEIVLEQSEYLNHIPDWLKDRVSTEFIGYCIASERDPIIATPDAEKSVINLRIEPKFVKNIHLLEYYFVLDLIKGQVIAVQLTEHLIYNTDNDHISRALIGPPINPVVGRDYSIFEELKSPHLYKATPIALLLPVNTITNGQTDFQRMGTPRFAPSLRSPVFEPNRFEILQLLGLPSAGLFLGALAQGDEIYGVNSDELIPIFLQRKLLRQHVSINGKTGTGKTELIKSIILQLGTLGFSVVATDTQGDIVSQIYSLIEPGSDQSKELLANQIEFSIWRNGNLDFKSPESSAPDGFGARVESDKLAVLYPPKTKNQLAKLLGIDPGDIDMPPPEGLLGGMKILSFELKSSSITSGSSLASYLPNLTDRALNALPALFNVYLEKFNNQFDLENFYEFLQRESDKNTGDRGNIVISSPNHRTTVHPASLSNIIRELGVLINREIFDRPGAPEGLKYDDIISPEQTTILFIPNTLPVVERRIYEFQLFDIILSRERDTKITSRAIVLDEAQDIIPRGYASDHFSEHVALQFDRFATQGRKYGISIIVGSQEPKQIHRTVFNQCNTKLFFRLSHEDVDYVKNYIPSQYRPLLTQYRRGFGILISPDNMDVRGVELKYTRTPTRHHSLA
ncbi:MAG: ATP-binding protein [Candidatus Odinarchaeota archaeon]